MNEKAATAAGLEYDVWTEAFEGNDRSLAEGEKRGKIKMILEWVAVLGGKVKLSTLAAAVHPYPTLGEINKRVAGSYFSPKIFSDRVRKGLRFFFHLKGRAC